MKGHDLTSSRLAAPPRTPLPESALSRAHLTDLGRRIVDRTWEHGLPTWSWGEAVALVGMIRFAQSVGEPVPPAVHDWFDGWVASGVTVEHVNDVAPGIAAVLAARDDPVYLGLAGQLAD